jgi:cyclophilin family peptidyl-prolyl cis-trans isomerase
LPLHLLISSLRRAPALLLLPLAAFAAEPALPDGLYAEITTPRGVVTCRLEYEKAPLPVANFVGLAEGTLGPSPRHPFFDGLTFNRVVPHFVVQGGDPLGNGEGGPGYSFPDQFVVGLSHGAVGVLSMANDGPDTNGSQFFITLEPVDRLDFLHSVFGMTVRGLDVLPKIVQGDTTHVRILRLGAAARAFRADDAAFAALLAEAPKYSAELLPGPKAFFDDPDKLLPKNFNFKLGNVQRATGVKIYARLLARFVPTPDAPNPDAFAGRLASSLGLDDRSVLAVYFADRDQWVLSVGTAMVGPFTGSPLDPHELVRNGALAGATDAFLRRSRSRASAYLAQSKLVLPNNLQTPAQLIKASVDGVLDELIEKLTTRKQLTRLGSLESSLDIWEGTSI